MTHQPDRQLSTSVIFANLTDEEYTQFQAHHILYSGATGKGQSTGYEPYGPYIATFLSQVPNALYALRWKQVAVKVIGNEAFEYQQLILRRSSWDE